jgi:hypothetical protein
VATTVLLYSEFEPYREFVECLGAKLRDVAEVSLLPIEHFVLSEALERRGCFVFCTNVSYCSPLVEALVALGNRVLNPGIATRARDRLTTNAWLSARNVSVPAYWTSANPAKFLESVPPTAYPIVLKPLNYPKQTHLVIENREMLRHHLSSSRMPGSHSEAVYFAQQYNQLHEYTKVYACASQVAAYRKFIPFRTPERLTPTEEIRSLAARVADVLDLDFFSLDLVLNPFGVSIVDVNTYPIFKFHPEAYEWMIGLVRQRLQESLP